MAILFLTVIRISVFALLVLIPQRGFGLTVDFETLSDGDLVTTQFSSEGILFANAMALTAGISLNEFEFPPKSGSNVVTDDSGPMTLLFSAPIVSFRGFFTYLRPITVSAFDAADTLLLSVPSAFSSNLQLSGDAGSNPNELLAIAGVGAIHKVTLTGDPAGGSFVLDDLTFRLQTDVPEPSMAIFMGMGLLWLMGQCRRGQETHAEQIAKKIHRSDLICHV